MIVQFVQFESSLPEAEALKIAEQRAPQYRAVPGLVQKYYLKLDKPNHYGGLLIWESAEAMAAFRQTELSKSVPSVYRVVGAPDIGVHEVFSLLREWEPETQQRGAA